RLRRDQQHAWRRKNRALHVLVRDVQLALRPDKQRRPGGLQPEQQRARVRNPRADPGVRGSAEHPRHACV
ncbi:hypothetical protein LPJ57_009406, partial [Coemansia sp. RSA 486]